MRRFVSKALSLWIIKKSLDFSKFCGNARFFTVDIGRNNTASFNFRADCYLAKLHIASFVGFGPLTSDL